MKWKAKRKMSVWRYLTLGYLVLIVVGSVLLVLPFAAKDGNPTNYLDALFTATSATCVTGLIPLETGVHWSYFGQAVILILIQLGGLGFMTFVSVLILMVRGGLGLSEKTAMLQSMGGEGLGQVKKLVRWIVVGTFSIEAVGACLLTIRFVPEFGAGRGVWFAVWHAVSAFCNAGFDLMGDGLSLTRYATDPLVSLVISALIILGGLGFCVWSDVVKCRGNVRKYHLYTKIVLLVTGILLVCSTALFLLFEWNNEQYANYHFGEKLLCCFFQATTTRTAGFFTTHPSLLSDSGYLLTVILMFIGGGSGSTAGGIKVSTMAVIVMGMVAVFRGKRDIDIGSKRIDQGLLGRALAILVSCLMMVLFATLLLCAVQPDGEDSFRQALFEAVSALGTVGLSMSYTATLTPVSQIVIILLMFAGRVGVLTIALALSKRQDAGGIRRPLTTLFIG